jgi:hypothetical protein
MMKLMNDHQMTMKTFLLLLLLQKKKKKKKKKGLRSVGQSVVSAMDHLAAAHRLALVVEQLLECV